MAKFAKDKGYQMTSSHPSQQETLSESVNLEDLIDDYDSNSHRSTYSASLLNAPQSSRSYVTAVGDNESYHTALLDSFSLSEYESANRIWNPLNFDFSSINTEPTDRDSMISPTNFQVFWYNLSYKIKPSITVRGIWLDLQQIFLTILICIRNVFTCVQSKSYNLNGKIRRKEQLTLIQNIYGSFRSGELTAVMGPSGAGKTSLLNFLSRRGKIGYSGRLCIDSERPIKICTIPQNDHQPEYLTVRENLLFASRLKNPQRGFDHMSYIEEVCKLLGLDECLDTKTKNISGGQHKRVSIAQELLSKPDILILDEPTSGLDSLTCFKTVSVLRNLVKSSTEGLIQPIAVVISIHQPQKEVFELFDKIYVMAEGGRVIYDGSPIHCLEFINKHTGLVMQDEDYNPASFLIEIASGEYSENSIGVLGKQVELIYLKDSESSTTPTFYKNLESETREGNDKLQRKSYLSIDEKLSKRHSMNDGSFWSKTSTLSERYWLSIARDPKQLIARLLFHILFPVITAIMIGTEPGRANACPRFIPRYELQDLIKNKDLVSNDAQDELLMSWDNLSTLVAIVYSLVASSVGFITLGFTYDIRASLKEFYNGWYSLQSYLIARFLVDTPIEIFLPTISIALSHILTGQLYGDFYLQSYRVIVTALAVILGSMIAQTIGMVFGAVYMNQLSTALFASQGLNLPFILMSGSIIRFKHMSKVFYFLSFLSYFRHSFDVAIIARYGYNVCQCNPDAINQLDAKITGVSEQLRSFTQLWLVSQDSLSDRNVTSPDLRELDNYEDTDNDVFSMFAKQISLYNSYGISIRSCDDVKPFQLHDLNLNDSNIFVAFWLLVIQLVIVRLLLFIILNHILRSKT